MNEPNWNRDGNESIQENEKNNSQIREDISSSLKQNIEDLDELTNELDDFDQDNDRKVNFILETKKKINGYISEIKKLEDIIKSYNANERANTTSEKNSLKKDQDKSAPTLCQLLENRESYLQLQQKLIEVQAERVENNKEVIRITKLYESLSEKYNGSLNDVKRTMEQLHVQENLALGANNLLETSRQKFENELRNQSLVMESLQHENESQIVQLDRRKTELDQSLHREREFKKCLETVEKKIDKIKSSQDLKISQLKERNQSLKNDLEATEDRLRHTEVQYDKCHIDLQGRDKDISSYIVQLKVKEDCITTQKRELERITILEADLVKKENGLRKLSLITEQLGGKDEKLLDMKHKFENVQKQFDLATTTINELNTKETKLVNQNNQIVSDLSDAHSVIESLSKTVELRENNIMQLKTSLDIEKSASGGLKDKLKSVEEEQKQINTQLADAHVYMSTSTDEINSLKEQLQNYQEVEHHSKQTISNLIAEKELLQERSKTLKSSEESVSQLKTSIEIEKSVSGELKGKLDLVEEEQKKINTQLADAHVNISKSTDEVNSLKEQLQHYQETEGHSKETISNLIAEKELLQGKTKTLELSEESVTQLKIILDIEKSVSCELKGKLELVEEDQKRTNTQLADAHVNMSKSTDEVNSLKEQLQHYQEIEGHSKETISNLIAENESLKDKYDTVSLSFTNLQRSNEESRLKLPKQLDTSDIEHHTLLTEEFMNDQNYTSNKKLSKKRGEICTSDKSIQFETAKRYNSFGSSSLDGILIEQLTTWVDESLHLGSRVHKCLKEATELSKLENFMVPITYSLETGNEHLTGQISLVFNALLAILKKYQGLTNIMKTSAKICKDENSFHEEQVVNEDVSNEHKLLGLLSSELENSSGLYSNLENLKNLVELNILKIIMQKPAPMLQERQMFTVVRMLTIQLLQYFSLSQKKDRFGKTSTSVDIDEQSFDFSLVNMMPEKVIHSNLEFSFDDCGQDCSMNSLMLEPEENKTLIESALCPQLVKVLKGNTDFVDVNVLHQEVKQFETSLEAAIGLIEAQLLSKGETSSLQYVTLNEPKILDEDRIIYLQDQLSVLERDNEELRGKLHQVQGLLSGAREQNLSFEEENIRLEEYVCKLSREIETFDKQKEAKLEIHTIHTTEGQDLQKIIRDSRDKVNTLLASKKNKNLAVYDLIIMNDELEGIVQKVLKESEHTIDQVITENVDLSSQLQAAERKMGANKRFIEEQIIEKDKEGEQLQKENENLQKALKEKESREDICSTLHYEVESLQNEILKRDSELQSEIANKEGITVKLSISLKKIEELRGTIETMEGQLSVKFRDEDSNRVQMAKLKDELEIKFRDEDSLRVEVSELREQLEELQLRYKQQIENVFESGFEDNFSGSNKCSDDEQPAMKSESPNFGLSVMEELGQNSNIAFQNLGMRRLESLQERVEKAVAANINSSRTSISHCSEEDISAKDTIDTSADIGRTLSPNTLECKMDEKLTTFELHIETLIKHNSDIYMQLKNAKKECEEIGIENENNMKRLDAMKESLNHDVSVKERNLSARLQEANSEREELQKKYQVNLLKISSLQATIDEAKRVPRVDEEQLNRVAALQVKLANSESMLSVRTEQTNELNCIVRNLKSILSSREEEIKRLISRSLKTNVCQPSGNVSKSLDSHISDGFSCYSEIQRRDPGTRNASIISEITKPSDIHSYKDEGELGERTSNHSLEFETAAIEIKLQPESNQKIDDIPVNKSFASEDSFSLNKEFAELENERTKLQQVAKLVEEKNFILIKDIELLTDDKLELESKLVQAEYEMQGKGTLISLLTEKNAKQLTQVKDELTVQIDDLTAKNDKMKSKFEREKSVNASLIKNLCEKDKLIKCHQTDICELEEKYKKEAMNSEQMMFERMTKQMKDIAENLNNEKRTQIQKLEENYKGLLARQDDNHRTNVSLGSCQDTILNLTMEDLENLRTKKIIRKVYREGRAILSLTEGEHMHNSLLDFSMLSDSTTSLEASKDFSFNKESYKGNGKYKALCTYLEEKLDKLESDKKSLNEEISEERVKHVELLKEKGENQLKFDELQFQLKDMEETVQFYKMEAENVRRQLEFLQDQLLVETSNNRKQRITSELELKAASENEHLQEAYILELKSSLEKERTRIVELIYSVENQNQKSNLCEKSMNNIFDGLSEKSIHLDNEESKAEIQNELEEAKFKLQEVNSQLNSIQLENNLLRSKMEHKKQKIACLELQKNRMEKQFVQEERSSVKSVRKNIKFDVHLPTLPSFRGEEISLRKAVVALQSQVESLQRENSEKTSEVKTFKHLWEMINVEKQEIIDLYRKLYESQSDKETLRTMSTAYSLKYLNKNNVEVKTASTNTDAISYSDELKMYLMYSQQGRQHNRILLWNLIESRQQLKKHHKALVFQKKYLMRRLKNYNNQDNHIQRLTSIAMRATQPGHTIQIGTQTVSSPRNKQFRIYAYAVIYTIRMASVKEIMKGKIHKEYFRLLKAITSDEVAENDNAIYDGVRPTLTEHTPPTKDIKCQSSAIIPTSKRNLFTRTDDVGGYDYVNVLPNE